MTKAAKLSVTHADTITDKYMNCSTVTELATEFKCSYNTMMIVLGVLDFPSTPYFEPQIISAKKQIEEDKIRRTVKG